MVRVMQAARRDALGSGTFHHGGVLARDMVMGSTPLPPTWGTWCPQVRGHCVGRVSLSLPERCRETSFEGGWAGGFVPELE